MRPTKADLDVTFRVIASTVQFMRPQDRNYWTHVKNLAESPTGDAKITHAFNLPCKWIIHTTGPRKLDNDVPLDWKTFRQCYVRCLELARINKVTSLAFCCLSTGIFAYPRKESVREAVSIVQAWLKQHPDHGIKLIIFNVFTYEDLGIYCELFHA